MSHFDSAHDAAAAAAHAKQIHPFFKIGICLACTPSEMAFDIAVSAGLDMVWTTDVVLSASGFSVDGLRLRPAMTDAGQSMTKLARSHPQTQFYVSLDNVGRDVDVSIAADIFIEAGFIPTVHASATSATPDAERLAQLIDKTGGKLAVATGVGMSNVFGYSPFLGHMLVGPTDCAAASSVKRSHLARLTVNSHQLIV